MSASSGVGRVHRGRPALGFTWLGVRETMASSSVPPATVPAPTAASGTGFGFASKTKKKHFVQQKVKVFRAADPLMGVFLWGVAHSVRPGPGPGPAEALSESLSSSGLVCFQAPASGAPSAATSPPGCSGLPTCPQVFHPAYFLALDLFFFLT